jgi:hypothetical protein
MDVISNVSCTPVDFSSLQQPQMMGERGINSSRQQTSHRLKAAEKYTVGWTGAPLFISFSSSSVLPRHIAVANLLTQFIRCWWLGPENLSVSVLKINGLTNAIIRCTIGSSDGLLHSFFAPRYWSGALEIELSVHPTVQLDLSPSAVDQIMCYLHCYHF